MHFFNDPGAVELENLPLRKDALREFDLPFEVKAGWCYSSIWTLMETVQ